MVYNRTQKYFLLVNGVTASLWLFVLLRWAILYPLVGARFLPGGLADFHLSVLLWTVFVELLNYVLVFRHIPTLANGLQPLNKPYLWPLVVVCCAKLASAFFLYEYPAVARSEAYSVLVLSQSTRELTKWLYNLQKVRLYSRIPKVFILSRNTAYMVFAITESLAIMYLVAQSLIYKPVTNLVASYDSYIKIMAKALLIIYLPVAYTVYKKTVLRFYDRTGDIDATRKAKAE